MQAESNLPDGRLPQPGNKDLSGRQNNRRQRVRLRGGAGCELFGLGGAASRYLSTAPLPRVRNFNSREGSRPWPSRMSRSGSTRAVAKAVVSAVSTMPFKVT